MGLLKRQKHYSVTKRHAGVVPAHRNGAAAGRRSSKRSDRARDQKKEPHAPLPTLTRTVDAAPQMMGGHRCNYPPLLRWSDIYVESARRYIQPALFGPSERLGPNLGLLHLWSENRLLIESGSAVTRLMDLDDHSLSDIRRPSDRAHVRAHQMLVDLANLEFSIVATDVYSDPDGAIRLLWARDDRTVELVFPSIESEAPYLYHSDARNYGVEENPSADYVWKWLNWVINSVLPGHVSAA